MARVVTAVAGAPRAGVEVWVGAEMVGAAVVGGGAGSGGVVAAVRVGRMLLPMAAVVVAGSVAAVPGLGSGREGRSRRGSGSRSACPRS